MASIETIKKTVLKIIGGLQSEKAAAVVVYRPSKGATDIVLLRFADDYVRY